MLRYCGVFIYLHGDDDLIVGPMSGPGAAVMDDWEFHVLTLSLREISDVALGKIMREMWSYSRDIPLPNYKDGEAAHMRLRDVNTIKNLYRGTKCVSVIFMQREIIINANRQYGVGCYEPIPDTKMKLPESTTDEIVGEAVRQALAASIC